MTLTEPVKQQISDLVSSHRVVLFMKGSRHSPQCGFSAKVVRILDDLSANYETVDVLRSPEIREGIKEYSKWPTIPQLYVAGQFIGGCDIVGELSSSGELGELLGAPSAGASAAAVPAVSVNEAARKAFEAALADAAGDFLRLTIDGQFQNDLFLGAREAGDVEVDAGGLTLLLDRASAGRANGLRIEFVEGPNGGFKIHNPNEPPSVKQLSAPELKAMLDRGELVLFDVRPEDERRLASIAGARPLDAAGQDFLLGLDRSTAIAFHCHHGMRSQNAAQQLLGQGFEKVYNLKGGIEAWSQAVDPSVPRY